MFANRWRYCVGFSGASNQDCSKRRDTVGNGATILEFFAGCCRTQQSKLKVGSNACGSFSGSQQTSPVVSRTTSSSGSADMRVGSSRDFRCRLLESLLTSDSTKNPYSGELAEFREQIYVKDPISRHVKLDDRWIGPVTWIGEADRPAHYSLNRWTRSGALQVDTTDSSQSAMEG